MPTYWVGTVTNPTVPGERAVDANVPLWSAPAAPRAAPFAVAFCCAALPLLDAMAAKDGALINSDSEAPRSRPALYGGIPIGICYAASMGVCGNVLVGIGDALVEIADKVRCSAFDIRDVHLSAFDVSARAPCAADNRRDPPRAVWPGREGHWDVLPHTRGRPGAGHAVLRRDVQVSMSRAISCYLILSHTISCCRSTYHGNGILCCCLLAVTALWCASCTLSPPPSAF
eukprot:SAG31_NODE_1432_length_8373_cov_8.838289_12_plen_229_part_00